MYSVQTIMSKRDSQVQDDAITVAAAATATASATRIALLRIHDLADKLIREEPQTLEASASDSH
jgi:hypothetical protein